MGRVESLKYAFLSLAFSFALKVLARPDPAAVIGMIAWLIAFGILEFYGPKTARSRSELEELARAEELEAIRGTLKQITLALGMRGTRIDKTGS